MNEPPKTAAEFYQLLASMGKEWLITLGLSPESADGFIKMVRETPPAELNMLGTSENLTSKQKHQLLWDMVAEKPKTWEELYAELKTRIDAPHAAVKEPYIRGGGGLGDARKDHKDPKAPIF